MNAGRLIPKRRMLKCPESVEFVKQGFTNNWQIISIVMTSASDVVLVLDVL